MDHSHHPDPIRRDLTTYTVATVLITFVLIAAFIGLGILLKQDRKTTIMRGGCYVAWDGYMICTVPSKVAR